jgi:hypothetical protein
MVKLTALALVALTAAAHASPPDYVEEPDVEDEPAFNMLGFRFAAGAVPRDGGRSSVLSLGLGVEHPVFGKTRMFGEYEWLWLAHYDERAMDSVVVRPERRASGHRASLGLRRELLAKTPGSSVRLFIDVELGAGLALVDDNMTGFELAPAGIAGLRVGYDIYSRSDESPSRTFEAEMLFRALFVEGGVGGMAGIGILWGN